MKSSASKPSGAPQRVCLLGSGALHIGQAGEFDYSGAQALKALREEGIYSVLINPNIATVQTDPNLASRVYLTPVTPDAVAEVLSAERADGILLGFGGQTALNCGLELEAHGVFRELGVRVLGTPVSSIRDTEDRQLFARRLREIGVLTPRGVACRSYEEGVQAAKELGFPIMLRAGFALGGRGSGIVDDAARFSLVLRNAFASGIQQVQIEECLFGWKEVEYEVLRDRHDNCIAVCNMENLDPLGIHTGESIVVAPSQTLNDTEYQSLRSIALKTIRHLGIIGECNIQFALDPKSDDYRVIEVNARLSRSSALASKATGYPLAYVAAKLAIGYGLSDIPNSVTGKTTAFFEPALDYIVCKVPAVGPHKFHGAIKQIGSEMKSVGEVMAIGRSFPEVLQKALRMLDIGVHGLDPDAYEFEVLKDELRQATPRRIFGVARAIADGLETPEIAELTRIDPWFIDSLRPVLQMHRKLQELGGLPAEADLREAKKLGFSDRALETLTNAPVGSARELRTRHGIRPNLAQIDTSAGEFPAVTNYLYASYGASFSETRISTRPKIMLLGSGVYRIGSSVEFDWSCVNAVSAISRLGYSTIMVNYNPETVSTDYDVCDELIFDEVSIESVLEFVEIEQPVGVVVSMGGQVPNNLAVRLAAAGVRLLGTDAAQIDRAEDRNKFSRLLDELAIDQPAWSHVLNVEQSLAVVDQLGGFPVLVRPSYVLSGAAMSVAHEPNELAEILGRAKRVSPDHPVVISKFEINAREFEVDAVASQGKLVVWAACEHVENAGIHSGDATLILPPQRVYVSTLRQMRQIVAKLAEALAITGPFNVQFLARDNQVKVIECNLRASRSFPFVSKVVGFNLAEEAASRMLGAGTPVQLDAINLNHVGVKVSMFSFARLHGVDPLLGVEMSSTGEVGCLGMNVHEALLQALTATGFRRPKAGVLLSLGPVPHKYSFAEDARLIADVLKLPLFATPGTAEMLQQVGIASTPVSKDDGTAGSGVDLIERGVVDLVINVPREYDRLGRPDGYQIRRRAVECGVPLFTDLQLSKALLEALRWAEGRKVPNRPMDAYW